MAMKYIKLFESWKLMEAEERTVAAFSGSAPHKTPVLKTTIANFNSLTEEQEQNFIEKLLKRAKQNPDSDKFERNPEGGKDLKLETITSPKFAHEMRAAKETFAEGDREDNIEKVKKMFGIESDVEAGLIFNKVIVFVLTNGGEALKYYKEKDIYYIPRQFDDTAFATYKIKDPLAQSDVYFAFNKKTKYADGDLITDKWLQFCFVVKDGKLLFWAGQKDNKHVTLGMLLNFVSTNMSPDDTDFLDTSGMKSYAGLNKDIFGGEEDTAMAKVAKTIKIQVGDQMLTLSNDETPIEKGGKGIEMPLFVGPKIIGSCGFDFNKSTLKEDSKKTLTDPELWEIMKTAGKTLQIVGHTDGSGSKEYNQKLSEARAKSVLEFLKTLPEFKDLPKTVSITSIGKGFDEKVMDDENGKNSEAAAKNRRVVILVDGKGPNYDNLYK